ncbi:MAG TPA: endonuclease/exonuclease/phosphatase family protein [Gemmatimonadaceae bacterium]|nr:endonuclease/exonuclease/phosphatase family protein [Gemmatimonadaceae bacterium]
MRRTLLLALAVLATAAAPVFAQDQPLTVMAFNLRYASNTPPNAWPDRRPVVREVIERWAPDIVGTQEGLYQQLRDIDSDLPAYAWIGEGRDGGSGGEFMAVFYRTDRLEPRQYGHYWLSDTPETIASRSWGNTLPRMVTWVRFRDRASGREHYLINTHFDHQSQPSRERSAALVIARAAGLDSLLPVILVGDFNAAAGENPVHAILTRDGGFADTWTAAGHRDTLGTFHDFRGLETARGAGRIDWILVRGRVETLSADIVTDQRDGQYPSDHFPVIARVRLPATAPR